MLNPNRNLILPVLKRGLELWSMEFVRFLSYGLFMVLLSAMAGMLPLIGVILGLAIEGPLMAGLFAAARMTARGESPSLQAFAEGGRGFDTLLLLSLITQLLCLLGGLLLVIPYFLLSTAFSLVLPVMVYEKLSIRDCFRRSWELVRPRFLQVLGLVLFVEMVQGVLSLPLLKQMISSAQPSPNVLFPVLLGMMLLGPLTGIWTWLLYEALAHPEDTSPWSDEQQVED